MNQGTLASSALIASGCGDQVICRTSSDLIIAKHLTVVTYHKSLCFCNIRTTCSLPF